MPFIEWVITRRLRACTGRLHHQGGSGGLNDSHNDRSIFCGLRTAKKFRPRTLISIFTPAKILQSLFSVDDKVWNFRSFLATVAQRVMYRNCHNETV